MINQSHILKIIINFLIKKNTTSLHIDLLFEKNLMMKFFFLKKYISITIHKIDQNI